MTKLEIAERMENLAVEMLNIAVEMEYFGGFSPWWHEHAHQLNGAAHIARSWAEGMRAEHEND